jgi:hypothetical protein
MFGWTELSTRSMTVSMFESRCLLILVPSADIDDCGPQGSGKLGGL